MNKNFYALIIGFNKFTDQAYLPELEFAEKDAQDLYDALINPDCGNFPKENIHLYTGNISRDEIETELYVHAVQERGPQDTVLIYYSGHGFIAGDVPESYLATPDTDVLKILKNPNAGLQMEYLRKKIFLAQPEKRTKNMVFLLDCCYSGSFCPEIKGGQDLRPKQLVETHDFDSEGRVAFVSSPAGIVSRESKTLKNGIFTYYLVEGLRGKAIENHPDNLVGSRKNDVTMSSLVSYVQAMCPKEQPPIFYGKSSRIVLTHPKMLPASRDETKSNEDIANKLPEEFSTRSHISKPLNNPITKQVEYVDNLLRYLHSVKQNLKDQNILGNTILNAIRDSLNADFTFVVQLNEQYDLRNKFMSDILTTSINTKDYANYILSGIYSFLKQKKADLLPVRFGFCIETVDIKGGSAKNLIVIPLRLEYPREFLIINGVDDPILEYGEILGHALLSLYRATMEFSSFDVINVENFLLDEIKHNFGHVPYEIYKKRLSRFKEHLHKITFSYEPLVLLRKKSVSIASWEALARDPDTKRAPYELFQAAELWGPEFTTELDLYCLENAVKTYAETWKAERKNMPNMDPLAVNVYPDTLFRKVYKEMLKKINDDEILSGEILTLEISEKRPLSWLDRLEDKHIPDPTETFSKQIQSMSREFGVTFAIDDFGVGHSSADRLARLELDYVKIDRDILHHPYPHHTIKYVLDIVQSSHKHPVKVVIEGFDGESRISLYEIYNDLHIKFIQGHLIRKASPSLADLSNEIKNFIVSKITSVNTEEIKTVEEKNTADVNLLPNNTSDTVFDEAAGN